MVKHAQRLLIVPRYSQPKNDIDSQKSKPVCDKSNSIPPVPLQFYGQPDDEYASASNSQKRCTPATVQLLPHPKAKHDDLREYSRYPKSIIWKNVPCQEDVPTPPNTRRRSSKKYMFFSNPVPLESMELPLYNATYRESGDVYADPQPTISQ
ncbi:MAG: hypothetical protein MMC33_009081 [Icmadophila ericetorum]|nr:hypothetical protein [Icmadophila ericetorum]